MAKGKETVHSLVTSDSKESIVTASRIIAASSGSMTQTIENFGNQLGKQVEMLESQYGAGNIPECDLEVRLVPRKT